jgi:hypothetical protein
MVAVDRCIILAGVTGRVGIREIVSNARRGR